MGTIKSVLRKVQAINIPEIARESFVSVETDYAEENKKQLFEGFDKDGSKLKQYRSNKYARVKNEMNPLPGLGNPDFYVTGAFTNSRHVTINGNVIETTYSDEKAARLLERDPNISGLGGSFKLEFINEKLKPSFFAEVRKRTGL